MASGKLVYKDKFEKNSYSLIELGSDELVDAFESSTKIAIKGLANDEAVLCTESKTFIIRQVNTSNTVLLVNTESTPDQHVIHGATTSTIELVPCTPRLNRIDTLLKESSYSGSENEPDIIKNKTLYSYHDLLSIIQASENQLLDALEAKAAFQLDGYYRLFDRNYLHHLFDLLVTNATVHSYDFAQMTLAQAKLCITEEMNAVDQEETVPDQVVVASINAFVTHRVDVNDDDTRLTFDDAKICRFLGEWLLSNPRAWELNDFLAVWQKLGHDVFKPKLQHLDGLYLLHGDQMETFIRYFPVADLPTDPRRRFASLFAEKFLWTGEEIEPFLMDLAPLSKEREHLLLKFTRASKRENTMYYTSKVK
ncbi:hypothetical protein [Parasitella parasitica]|uniref:Sister chromatid cohesion protein DCC1 n=1 Tax=Parasitella parasitica TaxID=35722 RepID=A0A0B7N6W1_9FUNG|nr:hypothetical protein [Parasitella parasitica]